MFVILVQQKIGTPPHIGCWVSEPSTRQSSLVFQDSWWPGPWFSYLSSWLGYSESSAGHLALKLVFFPLAMASSHPAALLVLSSNKSCCLQAWLVLEKKKNFPLFNTLSRLYSSFSHGGGGGFWHLAWTDFSHSLAGSWKQTCWVLVCLQV